MSATFGKSSKMPRIGAPRGLTLPSTVQHVTQGEWRVATSERECFGTILGSCIATVIWDGEAQIGGMNHLLLPNSTGEDPANTGHQINLMELLINGVVQAGASRERLKAKVFGGARMIDGLGTTGAGNAAFVERYLEDEGIACVARSIGGTHARRLKTWPAIGRVQQLRLRKLADLAAPKRANHLRERALNLSGVELL